jgi:hypothetical protein
MSKLALQGSHYWYVIAFILKNRHAFITKY